MEEIKTGIPLLIPGVTPPEPKKETFGEQYLKGIKAESGVAPVKDIRSGILSEWDKNIFELIEKTRKVLPTRHFYICVTTKREYLVKNTIRNYFESKYDCPTPSYEQVVYKVRQNSTDLEVIWVLPNREACAYLKANRAFVDPKEHELLGYVLRFDKGELDQLAQKENGEVIQNLNDLN